MIQFKWKAPSYVNSSSPEKKKQIKGELVQVALGESKTTTSCHCRHLLMLCKIKSSMGERPEGKRRVTYISHVYHDVSGPFLSSYAILFIMREIAQPDKKLLNAAFIEKRGYAPLRPTFNKKKLIDHAPDESLMRIH